MNVLTDGRRTGWYRCQINTRCPIKFEFQMKNERIRINRSHPILGI